jgi:FKBP-type peptidyl-prolyl cis-trans isomerase
VQCAAPQKFREFAMRSMILPAVCIAIPVLGLAGCAEAKPSKIALAGGCDQKTASGLGYAVLKGGKGAPPTEKDSVTVSYKGTLKNGTVFDQSDKADFPVNDVVPGFGEGLRLMPEGSRYRFCIPAALGYGAQAAGSIPANSDLVFEVGLQAIARFTPPKPLTVAERSCETKLPSGLGLTVTRPGTGPKPSADAVVLVNYAGYLASDGSQFDANKDMPLPVSDVVPGFSQGLQQMQRGGAYRLCIPAALGYGARSTGPIPANSNLVFTVELIDFKSRAEIEALQSGQQSGQK